MFYGALMLGGDWGLSLLKAAMLGLMIAGAFWAARLHRVSVLLPAGLMLLGSPFLLAGLVAAGRPQLFTFCLLPGLLAWLEHVRLSGRLRRLWLVPAVGLVWANLHGGFVAGLALVLCYGLGEALRKKPWLPYVLAAAAWTAATALNPYGLGYWRFLAHALSLAREEILEWAPFPPWAPHLGLLKLAVVCAFGAIPLVFNRLARRGSWRDLPWPQLLVLAATSWQGLRAQKLIPLAVLAAACCLPAVLAWAWPGIREKPDQKVSWLGPAAAGAAGLLFALFCWSDMRPRFQPWQVQVRGRDYPKEYQQGIRSHPVEAVRFLEGSGGSGNLWTEFAVGEFAFWRLYPRFLVSLDGRLECVYPEEVFRRELRASWDPETARRSLERADWALLGRGTGMYDVLRESRLWRPAYEDETYAVFRRASVPAPTGTQEGDDSRAGWWPVSAFFHPERDRARFQAYGVAAVRRGP